MVSKGTRLGSCPDEDEDERRTGSGFPGTSCVPPAASPRPCGYCTRRGGALDIVRPRRAEPQGMSSEYAPDTHVPAMSTSTHYASDVEAVVEALEEQHRIIDGLRSSAHVDRSATAAVGLQQVCNVTSVMYDY